MAAEQSEQVPESSTGIESQDGQPNAADEARSSGADQGESPSTLLDAVRSAVGMDDEEAESPTAKRVTEAEPPDEGEPADRDAMLLDALDKLKDDKMPLHKIQRFREVLGENRTLKSQFDSVRPAIDRLNEINAAARRAGFTAEEMAEFFNAPALAKDDPAKAHEIVSKFAARLAQAAGTQLPADLQQEVDDGYVTEERARETARLRAAAERAKVNETLDAEDRERGEVVRLQNQIADSVNEQQRQWMKSDPDYTPAKHQMVSEQLELLVRRSGRPADEQGAVAMAKLAYDTVNKRLSQFLPKPRQVTHASGRRINAPAQSAPKTMREAIVRVLDDAG